MSSAMRNASPLRIYEAAQERLGWRKGDRMHQKVQAAVIRADLLEGCRNPGIVGDIELYRGRARRQGGSQLGRAAGVTGFVAQHQRGAGAGEGLRDGPGKPVPIRQPDNQPGATFE